MKSYSNYISLHIITYHSWKLTDPTFRNRLSGGVWPPGNEDQRGKGQRFQARSLPDGADLLRWGGWCIWGGSKGASSKAQQFPQRISDWW